MFNLNQSIFMVASFYDVLLVNFRKEDEFDIDAHYGICDIRSIVHSKRKFYVLANKCNKLLGYYLLEVSEQERGKSCRANYIINWKSKLDIEDARLFLLRDNHDKQDSLVVSYKSIHVNTYNILLISLETKMIVYRHESEHMFEASITSILLESHDFIMFSQNG